MITLETGLYLRVQELKDGPKPSPLQSGFNMQTAYRALGMFNPSETSDAFFILLTTGTKSGLSVIAIYEPLGSALSLESLDGRWIQYRH